MASGIDRPPAYDGNAPDRGEIDDALPVLNGQRIRKDDDRFRVGRDHRDARFQLGDIVHRQILVSDPKPPRRLLGVLTLEMLTPVIRVRDDCGVPQRG
jgi:hypothetical protein